MPDLLKNLDGLIDRASNRLIWKIASRTRIVATSRPIVSFTFDDVPDTALTNGAAILEKYGAQGTFYIAGGLEARVESDRTLIGREGCLDLFRRGHEIGCHTFAHHRVRSYGGALSADLDANARYLDEAGITRAATNFAFPYNSAWPLARQELGRRYRTCRGAGEAINRGPVDPLMLKSVEIRQPEDHAKRLTGWIDDVAANPGWLVFFTHDIADRPTPYGCTPATFEHLVRHARERGCEILTVDAATRALGWEVDPR
ncbi:polysaccharide deacetylase family protein [Rhizobium terrae]|uniref:polysaccharide deacetylase family protein n=1 Tax=Rhizobium terrae TaxID=2171756 RepID=UPI000E3BF39E|nr:polysaccharide deacetylase family protein [Rhizobium terrae]